MDSYIAMSAVEGYCQQQQHYTQRAENLKCPNTLDARIDGSPGGPIVGRVTIEVEDRGSNLAQRTLSY